MIKPSDIVIIIPKSQSYLEDRGDSVGECHTVNASELEFQTGEIESVYLSGDYSVDTALGRFQIPRKDLRKIYKIFGLYFFTKQL